MAGARSNKIQRFDAHLTLTSEEATASLQDHINIKNESAPSSFVM